MIHAPTPLMAAPAMTTQATRTPSKDLDAYAEEVDVVARKDCPCCGRSQSHYLKWIRGLHSTYKVRQGSVFVLTDETCPLFISIFGNCFGNNPASPYIIPQPPIEDSYVDPYYAVPLNTMGPHGATTNMIYRLSDREALITIVTYPPKAAYFGYQSYVFTRMMSEYVGIVPPFARTPSPDPARYEIFGSMGNDINNVIVERRHGVPWGRVAVYITTSNATLAHALMANAVRHGISRNSLFVEPIGSNVITGNGAEADDMLTLIRYAIPQSNSASSTWMNAIHQNVLVYKVSQPAISVCRYGQNLYTPHTVNTQETNFTPSLTIALQQLQGLLEGYLGTAQGFPVTSQQMPTLTTINAEGIPDGGLVGSSCIAYGTNCLGDDQDTSTYAGLTLKTLGAEETAFIIGVNHSALNVNNVYYVSLSIYDTLTLSGVASSSQTNPLATGFNSGLLTGSAQAVLQALGIAVPPGNSELIANLPNLYITFLARDIHNPTIAPASQYGIDLMGTSLVPAGNPISISERSYVVPGSTTGGNLNYMLYPIVIAATHDFP